MAKAKRPLEVKGASGREVKRHLSNSLWLDCQYKNHLPSMPVPRLLNAGANEAAIERRCDFSSLRKESKLRPVLFSSEDLLSRMELSSDDAYGKAAGAMDPPAPPRDGQLLRDDDLCGEERARLEKRARLTEPTEAYHRQAFGLQLTQHITNDVFTERQRFTTGRNAAEKKIYRDPPGFGSKEELAQKIGKTFKAAKEVPVHPTKPHLRPKRVMQVVPDERLWGNSYVQVAFDETPHGHTVSRDDLLMRFSSDPRTTCFSYFAPADAADLFARKQQYYWNNRGGFQQANETGEGKHVLLSIPTTTEPTVRKQVKFIIAPTKMKLQKLKTHRLDIQEDTKVLRVNVK